MGKLSEGSVNGERKEGSIPTPDSDAITNTATTPALAAAATDEGLLDADGTTAEDVEGTLRVNSQSMATNGVTMEPGVPGQGSEVEVEAEATGLGFATLKGRGDGEADVDVLGYEYVP